MINPKQKNSRSEIFSSEFFLLIFSTPLRERFRDVQHVLQDVHGAFYKQRSFITRSRAYFFCVFLFADTALIYINTFDDDDGVFLSRFPPSFSTSSSIILTLFFLSLSSKMQSNTSVYVGVIIAGALVGEKMVNKGFDSMWESRNKGKLFKDLKLPEAEEE